MPEVDPIDATVAHFEEMTRSAARIQEEVLRAILERNAATEYLQNCGLHGRSDGHSFRKCVPLVTHSHLKPYFDRIAEGDRSPILTADPIRTLSLSSGTTSDGEQKYLILYKEILDASAQLAKISSAYRSRAFPIKPNGRALELVFSGKLSETSGGLTSATATTHLFRSEAFKLRQARACSPSEVVRASDNREAMYCHILCAMLRHVDLQLISSTFAYTIVEALRTLELQWPSLCQDIRVGQLSSWVKEPALRNAMAKLLHAPNPELADALAGICASLRSKQWEGLIPAMWPDCKYVYAIMTGSMTPYLKRLQHYAGDLPLVSGDYGATESWIGVNANPKAQPDDVTFTVVPTFAYFEFIPLQRSSDTPDQQAAEAGEKPEPEPEPVALTHVEVGQEYEVVMTTYGGLYRYRLGDVVRVTGFFNASPQLAYVCRRNVLLTVHIDKNTEKDLQMAVDKGVEVLQEEEAGGQAPVQGVDMVDYTSYADLSSTPGHYVIFCELSNTSAAGFHALESSGALERCASAMDAAFVDPGYVGSRKVGTIGQLELCVLEPGTFRFLLDRYLTRGAAITQYKTPRCVSASELRNILRSRTRTSVLSAAYKQH